MTRDPLGSDPLGVDPVPFIQFVKNTKMSRAVAAYANHILLKGTTVANTITPGEPVGEDGLPLTEARRREIAAARAPYDPEKALAGELDYSHDAPPIETEGLGVSAQREIDKQAEMTVVVPRELVIRPLTDLEKQELGISTDEPTAKDTP